MKFPATLLSLSILLIINAEETKGSLSCYSCDSNSSMDDCIENQTEEVCSEEENRCGTFSKQVISTGEESFGKGCVPDAECQKYQTPGACERAFDAECVFTCCEENLCNSH